MTRAIEEFPERTIWGALGRSGALWGDLGRFRVKRTKRAVRSYRFARKARTVSAGYARTRSLSPSFTEGEVRALSGRLRTRVLLAVGIRLAALASARWHGRRRATTGTRCWR